jgi:hypothetical protein
MLPVADAMNTWTCSDHATWIWDTLANIWHNADDAEEWSEVCDSEVPPVIQVQFMVAGHLVEVTVPSTCRIILGDYLYVITRGHIRSIEEYQPEPDAEPTPQIIPEPEPMNLIDSQPVKAEDWAMRLASAVSVAQVALAPVMLVAFLVYRRMRGRA